MQHCPECGAPLNMGEETCSFCGKKIDHEELSHNKPASKRRRRTLPLGWSIGAAVLVVVLIVLLALLVNSRPKQSAVEQPDEPVCYRPVSAVMNNEHFDAAALEEMGNFFLTLSDGQGVLGYFDEQLPVSFDGSVLTVMDQTIPCTMDGDTIQFSVANMELTMSCYVSDALRQWVGDHYGRWEIVKVGQAAGLFAQGQMWDCCAQIELDGNAMGSMIIWDQDLPKNDPLAEFTLIASQTEEAVRLRSVEGHFMGQPLEYGQLLITSEGTPREDMLQLGGTYDDGEISFEWSMILRPWGTDWSDLRESDPDVLPPGYVSWYWPAVQKDTEHAPEQIDIKE